MYVTTLLALIIVGLKNSPKVLLHRIYVKEFSCSEIRQKYQLLPKFVLKKLGLTSKISPQILQPQQKHNNSISIKGPHPKIIFKSRENLNPIYGKLADADETNR